MPHNEKRIALTGAHMRISLLVLFAAVLVGCRERGPKVPSHIRFSGGDGSSSEREVVIMGATNLDAVRRAQRAWVAWRYPGLLTQYSVIAISPGLEIHETIDSIAADGLTNRVYFVYPGGVLR